MSNRTPSSLPVPGFRWRGLTIQIFTLIILPLTALLLLITIGGISLHQRAMRNLVAERDQRAARTAARALEEQLNHRAIVVRTLADRAASDPSQAHLEQIIASSAFLLPDFDHGLAFFSRTGTRIVSVGDPALWESLEMTSNPDWRTLLARDVPPTFTPIQNPQSGETLTVVAAASSKGGPRAVGAFSPAYLAQRILADIFTPSDAAVAFLIDENQHLLYRVGSVPESSNASIHPAVLNARDQEGGATYLQIEGREHVIVYSPIPITGWSLVIDELWESVASPFLETTNNAPLVLVPALIVSMIALWFGARQVVQPLQELETRAASLAWGDFEAIKQPVGGIDEIQRLQRALAHLARKVQDAQQSLKGYIGAITAGQEEERRRLARELHDGTIQSLIALNQRVQLARLAQHDGSLDEPLAEIQELTQQTIEDLRRLTRALRPVYLEDLGLVAALDMLVQETGQAAGLRVHFQHLGSERRLPPHVELALYRMAQEGLSNVTRHAQASQASLTLAFDQDQVTLTIQDNGQGFEVPESPAEFAPRGHFGLLGLHERAELIGAHLEIQSTSGQGTRLKVVLPIDPHSGIMN